MSVGDYKAQAFEHLDSTADLVQTIENALFGIDTKIRAADRAIDYNSIAYPKSEFIYGAINMGLEQMLPALRETIAIYRMTIEQI